MRKTFILLTLLVLQISQISAQDNFQDNTLASNLTSNHYLSKYDVLSKTNTASSSEETKRLASPMEFSVSPLVADIKSSGGVVYLTLTSNLDWKASANEAWLVLSQSYGPSDASITITFKENPSFSARNATITFSASGVEDIKASFTQAAKTNGVKGEDKTKQVTLAPNPATNKITITSKTLLSSTAKIELYTMKGDLIETYPFRNKINIIDINELEKGYYFLKIISDGDMTVKRFTKK